MSEPSPKELERCGHIGESGLTRIRVQTGVDLVGRSQYAEVAKCVNGEWASELVRIHNAHAALVEACEAAMTRLQGDNQYEGWADKKLIKQLYDALDAANNPKE